MALFLVRLDCPHRTDFAFVHACCDINASVNARIGRIGGGKMLRVRAGVNELLNAGLGAPWQ
jgi:hypothetical protein